jgi:hypothetical protein
VNVAAQPVELGDDDRALLVELAGGLDVGGELGAPVQRVRPLAGIYLDKAFDDLEPLPGGELVDGGDLGFEAEAGAALPAVDTRA